MPLRASVRAAEPLRHLDEVGAWQVVFVGALAHQIDIAGDLVAVPAGGVGSAPGARTSGRLGNSLQGTPVSYDAVIRPSILY